ncbi:hypothetical protein [Endozoicomonas ascidiicola]|uniref:hypothetical protein n=1 Tax=Endozoicomonas ascidiicola TaxID=1698521 RepID=UPI000AC73646|nr:hypothetical protein [Endozoicomonas ascidiicola]
MSEYTELMGELMELGASANPALPFTACILDASGQILVTACNASHISPLYSAEGLALHSLASEFDCRDQQPLTLLTTAEPDDLSLMAIYRARRQGININQIVYAVPRAKLKTLWPDDPSQSLEEGLKRFPESFRSSMSIEGGELADECFDAFEEGKMLTDKGEAPLKSLDIDQYWMTGDWLLDDWEDFEE